MSAHDFDVNGQNQPRKGSFRGMRATYARGIVGVCSAHGLCATTRIQHVRAALWWRPAAARVLLPRSISLFGVCATDVSRELAGHRNLSAGLGAKAVSRGVSWP